MPNKTPSPGGLRSPRNRALEIGTTANGFPPAMPYHAQAGAPPDVGGGVYSHNVETQVVVPEPAAPSPSPFKLGKE